MSESRPAPTECWSDLPRPNGIAFSPDEKFLYIADSGKKVWMRYPVNKDGSVGAGTLFCDPSSDKAAGGPDGIRVDKKGNLASMNARPRLAQA